MQFLGWIPNTAGRLSFTVLGDGQSASSAQVLNRLEAPGQYVIAIQRRASRDGPWAAFLRTSLSKKDPYFWFIAFVFVSPGDVPVFPPGDAIPSLIHEKDAILTGRIVAISHDQIQVIKDPVERIQNIIRRHNADLKLGSSEALQQIKTQYCEIVSFLSGATSRTNPRKYPAYFDLAITLDRSGRCIIEPSSQEGLTDDWKTKVGSPLTQARHAFYFLRDLIHKHYHHPATADQGTVVVEVGAEGDDLHWRQTTLYGLMRMVTQVRRRGRAIDYRNAMGVLAYAESFQRNFIGWKIAGGMVCAVNPSFRYDFEGLRASMQASLSSSEVEEKRSEDVRLLLFGTCLTAIGILFAAGAIRPFSGVCTTTEQNILVLEGCLFWDAMKNAVAHPIQIIAFSLLAAAIIGVLPNTTVWTNTYSGLRRLTLAIGNSIEGKQRIATGKAAAVMFLSVIAGIGFLFISLLVGFIGDILRSA